MISGIYSITQISTHRAYIGSALNLEGRLRAHRHMLRSNGHPNPYLQNTWNKCGEQDFEFITLLTDIASAELVDVEQTMIELYESHWEKSGFNLRRIARSNLGIKFNVTPKMLQRDEKARGRTYSEESLANMKAGAARRFSNQLNGKAMLTMKLANEIRARYGPPRGRGSTNQYSNLVSIAELSKDYGIAPTAIGRIIRGETYRLPT